MIIRELISYIFMISGGIFAIITVIGILRFPDAYTRIHAAAVVLTISAVLLTIGIAIYAWEFYLSLKILIIGLFFLASNPMATHAIARASYKKKIALPKVTTVDEYSVYLERDDQE
ncbi:MAG: monovalent cation/H(+) antiporter subunit G [Halanaerobiales bacterium]